MVVRDEQRTDDAKQQMVSEWAGEGALVLRKHAVYATIQCCEKRPKASSDMDTHTHTQNCKTSKYKHKIQNCMQHRKVET